jgi:hypothetical protein
MNARFARIALPLAALLLATSALADEAPAAAEAPAGAASASMPEMTPEQKAEMEAYRKAGTPGPQHARMAATAGTYDLALKSWHEPGGPAMDETGTATRTVILEGRVIAEDLSSSMMGQPFTGHGMSGYDNVTEKHWSTWTDSMSTGLMVSEGTCDAQDACTFTGSWNDPLTKKPVVARMTTRWTSPTVQVFEMYGPAKDGKEFKMMEITYTKR